MADRTPMIAGNWKMFKTAGEAAESARRLAELTADVSDRDIMIAPTFTSLEAVARELLDSRILLGAQNMHWKDQGAYTGEIAPGMLQAAGCRCVLIGHSERREYFGETDETVNKKMHAAIAHGLIAVVCVGETEAQRESGETFSVLDKQVKIGLKGFFQQRPDLLVVSYEPVWAIGTGKTATTEQAQEAHRFIRSLLEQAFGGSFAEAIRILYGGSVKPANIAELMSMPDIDGGLVGGASLEADTFSDIVHYEI
jgi:triosephosphate isomerase (TIM)